MFKIKQTQKFYAALIILAFFLIFLSSIINLYEKRHKIVNFIKFKTTPKELKKKSWPQRELALDIINNGGYILLFRHAEREKWIDVQKYDSIETLEGLKAEYEYFSKAVCLSDRGLVQARAMGQLIKKIFILVT